jgi:RNA polymerase sigma factor (TIGR02999 family)
MDPRQHPDANVSGLLEAWGRGDIEARDRLMAVVYQELRRRAAAHVRRERVGHTLQPTALVHETYLRLVKLDRVAWHNRAQFFGLASQMMRHTSPSVSCARQCAQRRSIGCRRDCSRQKCDYQNASDLDRARFSEDY